MENDPIIYHIGAEFLIFNETHARRLRSQRIVSQMIGCSPKIPNQILTSGLPCLINRYAVGVVLRDNLGKFKKLKPRLENDSGDCEKGHLKRLEELKEEAHRDFLKKRTSELAKRNIEVKPERIGRFDEKKMKITLSSTPTYSSSFDLIDMENSEVSSLLELDGNKSSVFESLYDSGFYVTSGIKFGSDFLAYAGDPVRYHAQYAVKVVTGLKGAVDLSKESFNEINALHRLCHGANKISLLAVVCQESNRINYWYLREREYLTSYSNPKAFQSITPQLNPI